METKSGDSDIYRYLYSPDSLSYYPMTQNPVLRKKISWSVNHPSESQFKNIPGQVFSTIIPDHIRTYITEGERYHGYPIFRVTPAQSYHQGVYSFHGEDRPMGYSIRST